MFPRRNGITVWLTVKEIKFKNKPETKAMPLLRHCNTGRTCLPLPITTTEKNFPRYTRCSENHNNTCMENRKIRGLKFDTP